MSVDVGTISSTSQRPSNVISLLVLTLLIHLTSIGHGHLINHMVKLTFLSYQYNLVI